MPALAIVSMLCIHTDCKYRHRNAARFINVIRVTTFGNENTCGVFEFDYTFSIIDVSTTRDVSCVDLALA